MVRHALALLLLLTLACGSDRTPTHAHQTWVGDGYVLALGGPWGPGSPVRGRVLEARDASGRLLGSLGAPGALYDLTWWSWLHQPLQVGRETWLAGIPAHPAWKRLDEVVQAHKATWAEKRGNPNAPHWKLPQAEARLYRSRDLGPWEERARFIPATPKGWIAQVVPLGNGTFLALAERLFGDGPARSPLARLHAGSKGRLEIGELIPVDPSGVAPAFASWLRRVVWTPHALVLQGGRGCVLLDPQDGHFLRLVELPDQLSLVTLQPTREGGLVLAAQPPWEPTRWWSRMRPEPRSRLDQTIANRLLSRRPPFWRGAGRRWFHLDPLGELREMAAPFVGRQSFEQPGFLVRADGSVLDLDPGQ
jgi:hypothetical protein